MRFFAAFAVVVSHNSVVVNGHEAIEPLFALTGYSLGHFAVNIFFVISGFLVAQSMVRGKNIIDYLSARMMRIIPAMLVMSLFLAFILGPFVSRYTIDEYFRHYSVWYYTPVTGFLIVDNLNLPGVFEAVPSYGELNTSLWTIRWEVLAYFSIIFVYLLGGLTSKIKFSALFIPFIGVYLYLTIYTDVRTEISIIGHIFRLGTVFLIGMAFYVYRDVIKLNILALIIIWLMVVFLKNSPLYQLTMFFATAYSIFWLAYIPKGFILNFNKIGDFSYGIYIFGFPLQQSLIWSFPELSVTQLLLLDVPLILCFAAASYYLIEKPAMMRRKQVANWCREFLANTKLAQYL